MDNEHVKRSIRATRMLVVMVALGVFGTIVLTAVTERGEYTALLIYWTIMFSAMIYVVWVVIRT